MFIISAILWIGQLFVHSGCERPYRNLADSLYLVPGKDIFYDLKKVEDKHFLPYVLEEISGLSHYSGSIVAAHNDEEGRLFFYDLDKREIVRAIRFYNSGDYEGVEIVNKRAFLVDSDGDIYSFDITEEREVKAEKMETPLSKSNDIEGLGYDPDRNRLMLLCKGDSDIEDEKVKGQAVYGYDLDQKDFKKKPEFTIREKDIKDFLEGANNHAYDEGKITFHPSGIALHPIHQKWYIIASVGKLLLVVDKSGQIEASYPISPRILSQPEGICFLPNGDMLISSEGEGDRGYIVRYKMKRR